MSRECRKVSEYSGGWQMRMCLGKILLQDPDVLILDEPTNHLDLDAIEWLERYVSGLEIPTVVISHDREFLDQVWSVPPPPPPPSPPPPPPDSRRWFWVSPLGRTSVN